MSPLPGPLPAKPPSHGDRSRRSKAAGVLPRPPALEPLGVPLRGNGPPGSLWESIVECCNKSSFDDMSDRMSPTIPRIWSMISCPLNEVGDLPAIHVWSCTTEAGGNPGSIKIAGIAACPSAQTFGIIGSDPCPYEKERESATQLHGWPTPASWHMFQLKGIKWY